MVLEYWPDFEKRKKSTKRPTSSGYTVAFNYKQPTSIYHPQIMVEGGSQFQTAPPRYAKIENLYYSVDDVQSYRDNVWILSLNVDAMATARDDIGATSAYVVRAASQYNEMLTDSLLVPEAETTITGASVSTGVFDGSSCYILQILDGRGSSSPGFLSAFGMTGNQLAELAAQLTQADIIGELFQTMSDVTSCIGSCTMVPVTAGKLSGSGKTIYCGHFNTGVSGVALNSPIVTGEASIAIPWKYNDFRRNPPYTSVMLYLPFIGNVELSTNDINSYSSLKIYTTLDVITGVVAYSVQVGAGGIVIGEYSAQAGAPIPTSSYTSNALGGISGAIGSLATGAVAGVTANPFGIAGAVGQMGGAIMDFATHTAQVRGAQGSLALAWQTLPFIRLEMISRESSDTPANVRARNGSPLMARRTIGSLSGYVQTMGANINAKWPAVMKQEINSIMDGGFWYE